MAALANTHGIWNFGLVIRSQSVVKWSLLTILVGLALAIAANFVYMSRRTVRAKRSVAEFLASHPSEMDLRAKHRTPRRVYSNYSEIPEKFKRGLLPSTNCEFHLYTKEGMPYWYFIAAVDRTSRTVTQGIATNY
jgi:hypothetical protein